ncbi:MAG: hypothetical protein ABIA75_04480 [Candidatus Neomarinimicrobiota bacterium]
MIKFLLYGVIVYLGYRIFKYMSNLQISASVKSKSKKNGDKKPYSKFDIQDAEFKDIDE